MKKRLLFTLVALGFQFVAYAVLAADPLPSLDRFNVVWDSPSANSHGSMRQ